MTSARATLLWSLLAGLLAYGASLHWNASPDLSGVMAEVDGVHPVRAAQALREGFAPGGGFLDKYPPLGSFVMGLVVAAVDGAYGADSAGIPGLPPEDRRERLWALRDRTQRLLQAERVVSRVAMAAAVALLCALALAVLERRDGPARSRAGVAVVRVAALGGALAFGLSAPALYYASTTNVDALALLAGLATLLLCVRRRWVLAAVAVCLAIAFKDPAGALAPLVLLGAWCDRGDTRRADASGDAAVGAATASGRRLRRVGAVVLAAVLAYALLSGAVTGPGVWWQHVRYLFAGGISGVDHIDHADPAQWLALVAYMMSLVRGALGVGASVLGVIGLLLLARRAGGQAAAGRLLLGALLATPVLFVLPIGFVYARFLLVPMAVLCVGLAALLVAVAEGPAGRLSRAGLLGAVACAALVVMGDRGIHDFHRTVVPSVDARMAMAERLPELVPPGARLALFADEREHGPPLDPGRWSLEVAGLDAAAGRLRDWAAAPWAERPDFVLWMRFPSDRSSGLPTLREPLPAPGTRVGDVFEVLTVLEPEAAMSWPVRSLTVRPQLMLLSRLPPP